MHIDSLAGWPKKNTALIRRSAHAFATRVLDSDQHDEATQFVEWLLKRIPGQPARALFHPDSLETYIKQWAVDSDGPEWLQYF